MTDFLQYLLNGISLGGIYALIALGFVIVFKATEVVNFAHGSVLVLGGYVIARAHDHDDEAQRDEGRVTTRSE